MPNVRLLAAEILLLHAKDEEAIECLKRDLMNKEQYVNTFAINVIESNPELIPLFIDELKQIAKPENKKRYPQRAANKLLRYHQYLE